MMSSWTIIENRLSLLATLTAWNLIMWISLHLSRIVIHLNNDLQSCRILLREITITLVHREISSNLSKLFFFLDHWHECFLTNRLIYHHLSTCSAIRVIHTSPQVKCLPTLIHIICVHTIPPVWIDYVWFPWRRLLVHHLLLVPLWRCHTAVVADVLERHLIPINLYQVTHTLGNDLIFRRLFSIVF